LIIPAAELAYGQVPNSENLTNQKLDQIFKQKIGSNYTQALQIDYVSPSAVVIGSVSAAILNSPTDFWKAIDILKNDYNFNLDKLIINGAGNLSVLSASFRSISFTERMTESITHLLYSELIH
jgi:hypothetical protein